MSPYKVILEHFLPTNRNEFKEMNLFEAGFGDFGYVLDLYYSLPFKKYHGIEKYSESSLSVMYENGDNGRNGCDYSLGDSVYKRYRSYCKVNEIQHALSENEFYSMFELQFEEPIDIYITKYENRTLKYDVGIFSNLFHKFRDKRIPQKIVAWFYSISTYDSFLLLKVMTTEKYANKDTDFIYNQEDIHELLKHFPGEIIRKSNIDSFETYLIKKNAH